MNTWGFNLADKTKRWGNQSASYGFTVSSGDVVGCLLEIHDGTFEISYAMNGEWAHGFGKAFKISNRSPSFSLTPVMSFERGFQGRFNLGRTSFRYPPRQATSIQYYAQRTLIERVVQFAGVAYVLYLTNESTRNINAQTQVRNTANHYRRCGNED